MSDQQNNETARSALKLVKSAGKQFALNMIPGYPLIGVVRSLKQTTAPGVAVIGNLAEKIASRRRTSLHVRSWNEALAARSQEALPLKTIYRRNHQAKWIFMVLCLYGLCMFTGSIWAGNLMGLATNSLFAFVCALQVFKFELRLRQMETGPENPDRPLLSAGDFWRNRDLFKHLLNPRIDWK
jgi:hypothetical protein